jgi:3-oxoadipate enol-lactonase
MPYLGVRGLRVYFELHGTGPRLLFISGTGGDLRQKARPGESLVGAFTVLAYDQRGLGRTNAPDGISTMADYAEDANSLLEAMGWERCHVMGVSFGGMVAQELALRFPQRVDRFVLACTSSGGAGGASYPLHEFNDLDMEERVKRFVLLADSRRDNAEWQSTHRAEFEALLKFMIARAEVGEDEPRREVGRRLQLEARRHHDTYDRLPRLSMPVYICGGKYDGVSPVENSRSLERQIPNARLELFEGGHVFLREDTNAYQRVMAFLRGDLDDKQQVD